MRIFSFLSLLFLSLLITPLLKAQTENIVPYSENLKVTLCDALIYDYGGSTGGLINNGADGSLTIYPSTPGTMIALSIADLDIDFYSDYLYIYNGENTSAPLVGTLQGAYNSLKAAYAGEYYGNNAKGAITIRLKTKYSYASADGMILRARCTPIGELNNMVLNQKRVITSCNTTIYDNGGSKNNYANNSKDTLLILPDAPNKFVQLDFQYVSINNNDGLDQIYFLGGLSTGGGGSLYAISGYNTDSRLGTATKPDGSASFILESDAAYVSRGFRTVVTCVNKTTTPLTEAIVPISGTASMKACNATISDNGDKYNYFPNSNGVLTINPLQAGTKVLATFSQFSLGDGDYLNFYDGATTSAPLIAKYTNTSTANPINATNLSGTLTVQFVSNASDEGAGFVFNVSCVTPVVATTILLTPATIEIDQFVKTQLTAEVLPANTTNKKLIWTSSDPTIATVTATGLVTAILPGSVTITAQSEETSTMKGSSIITVKPIPLIGITVSPSPTNIQIGLTGKLNAIFQPLTATSKGVVWSSSDPSIASVSANGTVTGIAFGTVTISAISDEGGFTGTSLVTVIPLSVRDVFVNPGSATIPGNGSIQLSVSFLPSNAANKQILWSSTNPGIATVNSSGLVEAVAPGSVYIYATSVDGNHKDNSRITVSPIKVTGMSFTENTVDIIINNTLQLNPIIQPTNATNKQLAWTSSNESIATVNSAGLVTGISIGSVIITAKTIDGNFSSQVSININPATVTNIGLGLSNSNVMIYPNPSEGSFNVKFPIPFETIEITNSLGQKETFKGSDLIFNTSLKGLLIIKINTDKGSYFSKLIIK